MPDESVVIKFGTTGADEAKTKILGVSSAFQKLSGDLQASVGFIQQQAKATQEAGAIHERAGKSVERHGDSHTHMSHKVRGAAHIVTGSVGAMAGSIDSEFGKIIGSIGMGAHMMRYFGTSVALAVVGLEAITTVLEHYIKKVKESIEFQTKLNMAVRAQDLGAARGMLQQAAEAQERYAETQKRANQEVIGGKSAFETVVAYWSNYFGPTQDEMKEKTDKSREAFAKLFELLGRPKLEVEVLTEQAKLAKEQSRLDEERAQTAGDIISAMSKEQAATEALTRAQINLTRAEEEQKAKALEAALAPADVVAAQRDASAKKIAAMEASAGVQRESSAAASEKKILGFAREAMTESLGAFKTYNDAKLSMAEAATADELAQIEVYSMNAEDKARSTERVKEAAAKAGATLRIDAINQEVAAWKHLAAEYPNNIEVQRAAQSKLNELGLQRLNIEKETNAKIVAERQSLIQKLKAQEAEKAAIGGTIEQKAVADLRKAGYTQITAEMVKSQAENRKKWGEYFSMQFDVMGASLSPEQFEYMQETAGMEKRRRKADVSTFGAVSYAGQERRASYGFGVSPEDMVSDYTGVGGEGVGTAKAMESAFKEVQTQVKTSLDDIKRMLSGEEVGGHNLANVITDMVVRKIEFEAARAA